MDRLNQFKGMTQMIQSNQSTQYICWRFFGKSSISLIFWKTFNFVDLFGKRSISLTFLGYFGSIQLIQSYQSLKVDRLSQLLYENELTQSLINLLGKWTESIQSILQRKWIDSSQSTQSSWLVYKSASERVGWWLIRLIVTEQVSESIDFEQLVRANRLIQSIILMFCKENEQKWKQIMHTTKAYNEISNQNISLINEHTAYR